MQRTLRPCSFKLQELNGLNGPCIPIFRTHFTRREQERERERERERVAFVEHSPCAKGARHRFPIEWAEPTLHFKAGSLQLDSALKSSKLGNPSVQQPQNPRWAVSWWLWGAQPRRTLSAGRRLVLLSRSLPCARPALALRGTAWATGPLGGEPNPGTLGSPRRPFKTLHRAVFPDRISFNVHWAHQVDCTHLHFLYEWDGVGGETPLMTVLHTLLHPQNRRGTMSTCNNSLGCAG